MNTTALTPSDAGLKPGSTLISAMLVTGVLGSVHAFSVFVSPLESLLDKDRASISLIYSGALVFLTFMVLVGHRIYTLASPGFIVFLACASAAVGMLITAMAENWWLVFFGYSILFGGANGVGYGYALQLVARHWQARKGLAMSVVTATYAVGAMVFSQLLARLIESSSLTIAFAGMAAILLFAGILAATLLSRSGARYAQLESGQLSDKPQIHTFVVVKLWLAYGLAVAAGLMAIGHAYGIAQTKGSTANMAVLATMFISFGSACGGYLAGWIINRWSLRALLCTLSLLSATFLTLLAWATGSIFAVFALTSIGFTYGAIIAVYPYAVSVYAGDELAPKIYGRVFTAWGLAGLAAPWMAGVLYDSSGNYFSALLIAAVAAAGSCLVILTMTQTNSAES